MKKALIGNGGHAREVIAQMNYSDNEIIRFVDDIYFNDEEFVLPLSKFNPLDYEVMICVGDSKVRESIYYKLPKETKYFSYIHPSALILDKNFKISEGSFVGANCIITTNVKIGKHFILNRGNHIGHDCIIGDFFSMMPGSIVSGTCRIGNNVYLGTNSSIRENTIIMDDVTIGLNTGIVKSIYTSGTYVGSPTKKIK